jgi:hypothetical protein
VLIGVYKTVSWMVAPDDGTESQSGQPGEERGWFERLTHW